MCDKFDTIDMHFSSGTSQQSYFASMIRETFAIPSAFCDA